MNTDPIVIVGLARTPMGAFHGVREGFSAPEPGAAAIRPAGKCATIWEGPWLRYTRRTAARAAG